MENKYDNYIIAVDAIIRTLLKNDREVVKEQKKKLIDQMKYGIDAKLEVYDQIFEAIVDRLEDSGYLTKEFIISAGLVGLEPVNVTE